MTKLKSATTAAPSAATSSITLAQRCRNRLRRSPLLIFLAIFVAAAVFSAIVVREDGTLLLFQKDLLQEHHDQQRLVVGGRQTSFLKASAFSSSFSSSKYRVVRRGSSKKVVFLASGGDSDSLSQHKTAEERFSVASAILSLLWKQERGETSDEDYDLNLESASPRVGVSKSLLDANATFKSLIPQELLHVRHDDDNTSNGNKDDEAFCRDNCYSPRCYAPWNSLAGGCVPSPYHVGSSSSSDSTNGNIVEFHCRDRAAPTDPSTLNSSDLFSAFKRNTAFLFDRWYDFDAKCADTSNFTLGELSMRGSHNYSVIMRPLTTKRAKKQKKKKKKSNNTSSSSSSNSDDAESYSLASVKRRRENFLRRRLEQRRRRRDSDGDGGNDGDDNDDAMPMERVVVGDGLYHLEMFCVKPVGRISGFRPQMSRYEGSDDTLFVTSDFERGIKSYLKDFEDDGDEDEPSLLRRRCYREVKNLVIFPITFRGENDGHAFYRAGSLLRVIEAAFGKSALHLKNENVTVMYVNTDIGRDVTSSADFLKKRNFQKWFYDMVSTSHFAVYGAWAIDAILSDAAAAKKIFRFSDVAATLSLREQLTSKRSAVCFRHAVVWMDGFRRVMKSAGEIVKAVGGLSQTRDVDFDACRAKPEAGFQTSFAIHGPKTAHNAQTLQLLDERIRSCGWGGGGGGGGDGGSSRDRDRELPLSRHGGGDIRNNRNNDSSSNDSSNSRNNDGSSNDNFPRHRRPRVRFHNPRVLFAVRSQWRRLSLQPFLISDLAASVKALFGRGSTLSVIEHSSLTFAEIVRVYSDADILIGMYGAALAYGVFLPPGAVIVEFNTWWFRYAAEPGVNRNRNAEYGGASVMANQFFIAMSDQNRFGRYPHVGLLPGAQAGAFDHAAGPMLMRLALSRAACLLRNLSAVVAAVAAAAADDDDGPRSAALPAVVVPAAHCQFGALPELNTLSDAELHDHGGEMLARLIAIHNNNLHMHSQRLRIMARHRARFAELLRPFRGRPDIRPTTVMIVERCAARPAVIAAELAALRAVLQRVDSVVVAEKALPNDETCQQQQQQQQQYGTFDNPLQQQQNLVRSLSGSVKRCAYPCLRQHRVKPNGVSELTEPHDLVLFDLHEHTKRPPRFVGLLHDVRGIAIGFDLEGEQISVSGGMWVPPPAASSSSSSSLMSSYSSHVRQNNLQQQQQQPQSSSKRRRVRDNKQRFVEHHSSDSENDDGVVRPKKLSTNLKKQASMFGVLNAFNKL